MFKKLRVIAPLVVLAQFISPITPSHAGPTLTLIASDSFAYSGGLVGQSGGTGFSGPWYSDYGVSDFNIGSNLTYANVSSTGGSAAACGTMNGQVCGVGRDFPAQESGVFYFQMIANFGTQTGAGTPTFRFSDSASVQSGGIGGNGGTAISIFDETLNTKGDGTASYGTLNGLSFVILQIDFYSKLTQMWVNPNMATFDYFNPPAANASWPGLAPKMAKMRIYARNNGAIFDEFKLYRVDRPAAPEISSSNTATTYQKGIASSITGTVDRASKVTFLAAGKRIAGCVGLSTTVVSPFNVSCNWKPTVQGSFPITMQITPTTGTPTKALLVNAAVVRRTNKR